MECNLPACGDYSCIIYTRRYTHLGQLWSDLSEISRYDLLTVLPQGGRLSTLGQFDLYLRSRYRTSVVRFAYRGVVFGELG